MASSEPLRIGVLGAAAIVGHALVRPARRTAGVEVAAIAARDATRAQQAGHKHGIVTTYAGYEALLGDSSLDAVYIPLPAALHGRWTLAALEAGKHVLVEKPFSANAEEAALVAEAVRGSGLVVMEAHHATYHPLVGQVRRILRSGVLGGDLRAHASFCVPIRPGKDIRWNEKLGGGSLMDLGCYPLRMLRDVLGSVPVVRDAFALVRDGVDRSMTASLEFPDGTLATVQSSMWSHRVFQMHLRISGDQGSLKVSRPFHPQTGARIHVQTATDRYTETTSRIASYDYQLRAFLAAIQGKDTNMTGPDEAIISMRLIDDIYRTAGMVPRQSAA
jgi:predicted dehydrogenase